MGADYYLKAIDAGNCNTKYKDEKKFGLFPSNIGYDWRPRNLQNEPGEFDFEWEYGNDKGFAGTLAKEESKVGKKTRKGNSKAHFDAKLRVLIALHHFSNDPVHDIVVGQPIGTHNQLEKGKIKEMLIGEHTLTLNGKKKTFRIRTCEVAPEGAAAGIITPRKGLYHVLDIGSGTVNFGTLIDGKKFEDKTSFTLEQGIETLGTMTYAAFGRVIANEAITEGWTVEEPIICVGGGALDIAPFVKPFLPNLEVSTNPIFANVTAYYELLRKKYGNSKG